MSRLDLLSPEGIRLDGRRAAELRSIHVSVTPLTNADGSAYLEQGNTKVLAAVYGPREARFKALSGEKAVINVEYSMAAFSTSERKKRSKNEKRWLELATFVKQTFEPVVQTHLFPRSQIDIYLHVLQEDGGALHACINAATLALMNAGIPMLDYVCGCNVGCVEKTPLLDLNRFEESSQSPNITVACLPTTGKITLLQMESKMDMDQLDIMLNLALAGCSQIRKILDDTMREHMSQYLNQMRIT